MRKYLPPPHFRPKTLDSTDSIDFTHFKRTVNRYYGTGADDVVVAVMLFCVFLCVILLLLWLFVVVFKEGLVSLFCVFSIKLDIAYDIHYQYDLL